MLVGFVGRIEPDFIGGWAADTEATDLVVDVIVYVDGKRAARIQCDVFRPDLRDLKVYGEGRHGFGWRISPPLPMHLLDRITVRFARTGGVVPNGDRMLPRPAGIGAILVTAPGRSGTTMLMGRLSLSPQICVAEVHPFEVRLISYWSTVVRTLTGKADHEHSMHPDRLEGDGFKVGSNPFAHKSYVARFQVEELAAEYFSNYVPQQIQDLARTTIEEFYLRVRDDLSKPEAVFLAEKNNNLDRRTRSFARALFPSLKEVVLIRDPRDLLCSQVAYFRHDPTVIIRQITEASNELLRIKREEADQVHFVRYEDLVLDAGSIFERLAGYLEIDPNYPVNELQEQSIFKAHATSETPEASIGRWKSQLPEDVRSLCTASWQNLITEFKYV